VTRDHMRARVPTRTPVFDSFWYLAAERQRIFRSRLRADNAPRTFDPVLREYKFTNAYRASDRTSQYLIRQVIYDRKRRWRDTFTRVMLFKLFNRIETWEVVSSALGEITADTLDVGALGAVLSRELERGERIYSAAYIMPNAPVFGCARKHDNHLRLLQAMLDDDVDAQIASCESMDVAYGVLLQYPSIGPFLGFQLLTDLNYGPDLAFDEGEFVVPGPGALDGIAKCFLDLGDLSPADVIRWTMETQEDQFRDRGIEFDDLWERPLQLIDCQNLFCEVDKYARVAHPEYAGRTGRTRIKQRFRPRQDAITAWYPPKWGINDRVARWLSGALASKSETRRAEATEGYGECTAAEQLALGVSCGSSVATSSP
jgi:hypothetical protein